MYINFLTTHYSEDSDVRRLSATGPRRRRERLTRPGNAATAPASVLRNGAVRMTPSPRTRRKRVVQHLARADTPSSSPFYYPSAHDVRPLSLTVQFSYLAPSPSSLSRTQAHRSVPVAVRRRIGTRPFLHETERSVCVRRDAQSGYFSTSSACRAAASLAFPTRSSKSLWASVGWPFAS